MRKILFRGKRIDNGEWVEGYYWQNEVGNHFIKVSSIEGEYVLRDYAVIPETVGQYTGLCDKNGKRIFEGDLLKGRSDYIYGVIYEDCALKIVDEWGNRFSSNQKALDRCQVKIFTMTPNYLR